MIRAAAILALALAAAPVAAQRTVVIQPYLEAQQVLSVDLDGGGDAVTYTALAAGIDASVATRNVTATASGRYEHRIPWSDRFGDQSILSGIARANVQLVPSRLSLDAGALATRARTDIRGAAPTFLIGDQENISDVWAVYAGPDYRDRFGDLDVLASYRIGYVKVTDRIDGALPAGQQPLDFYDDSLNHLLFASVGARPGTMLPVGWTVSGGYEREDASQLDQRYERAFVRGEVTVPVSPTVAVAGAVGYETQEASQRAPLLDVDGAPLLDDDGRFLTDPDSPRLLAYDDEGLIWDVGVLWRPSPRLQAEARVGHRYGGTFVFGALDWRVDRRSALNLSVYNYIDSFGRSLTRNLAALPASFTVPRTAIGGNRFDGCVFGANPAQDGAGGCLSDSFQSITTAQYRNRGVSLVYSTVRGPWTFGAGAGYQQRRYLSPLFVTIVNGRRVADDSFTGQVNFGRTIDSRTTLENQLYLDYYDSGIPGAPDVLAGGATSALFHNFTPRLSGSAAVGIYGYDSEGVGGSDVSGQLLLGARYSF